MISGAEGFGFEIACRCFALGSSDADGISGIMRHSLNVSNVGEINLHSGNVPG